MLIAVAVCGGVCPCIAGNWWLTPWQNRRFHSYH